MRVDRRIRFEYGRGNFESGMKNLRIQKYRDTFGRGLKEPFLYRLGSDWFLPSERLRIDPVCS